jgi:hypothetical protein
VISSTRRPAKGTARVSKLVIVLAIKTGVYIVPTHRWYIERTVWLIAGGVLLAGSALVLLVDPLWILIVTATGLVSMNVALTGFCPVGNTLRLFGFTPMLGTGTPTRWNLYFMQTDRWYLERRIYLVVGFNISAASLLVQVHSLWWLSFIVFVGGAMVWFAATGYCIMANMLYALGAEPRLNPEAMPSGRCTKCAMAPVCMNGESARPAF